MRQSYELPPDRAALHRKAVRLEWITIVYLLSAIAAIYVTLGASQAMKAAWFEDILSLVPAIAFLIGSRIRWRKPNSRFPYGYHRVMSISYLVASLALFLMGLFILYDSVSQLLSFEHPPIGTVQPFGDPIWLGWLMLPALAWSALPAVFLGRAKLPLARSSRQGAVRRRRDEQGGLADGRSGDGGCDRDRFRPLVGGRGGCDLHLPRHHKRWF